MPKTIFDNCVLSNFALSNSLDIVKKLYAVDESLNQMIKNGFYSTIKTINEMI